MQKNISRPLVGILLMLGSLTANAATISFTQITSNGDTNVSSQLTADVSASGSNILFTFYNNVGIASSIKDIYFDFGNTNFFSSVSNDLLLLAGESAGVSYSDGSNPPVLPGGNGSPLFFSVDASGGTTSPALGIDVSGEFAAFLGTTISGITLSDVLAGIDSGAFRLGLHVQAIDQLANVSGQSESYINTVPVPAAGWLFSTALLGLMGLRRKM